MTSPAAAKKRIDQAASADRGRLLGRLRREGPGAKLNAAIEASIANVEARRGKLPQQLNYPADLPVVARRDGIIAAIRQHQVVVVCGATGSGKTTQLPKLCLEAGLGARGLIGHTQPRRIAARTVAARIASELQSEAAVGYKIRFNDTLGPNAAIKLMTDGILLAESQRDRYLSAYDCLIVDEAHERSLNIDFLLGYLHGLLKKRRDLKLIITSATIDPQRFADYFGGAPIISVAGRSYPVETRYRELLDEGDVNTGIAKAVDELWQSKDAGDVLVFLPGERDIREAAKALTDHFTGRRGAPPAILPLFSRLSNAEQNRIFQPGGGRRIVLATNVAETSLTVPGIRNVIDTGLARISRYSWRSKVQRLPIEAISQASANQRLGRCGRTAPGICIRLYAEEDFEARPEFTDAEIRRTNLASVMLQMAYLGLGNIADFPFIDPPDGRYIRDGQRLLEQLQAVDAAGQLSALGKQLARLPLDPRIGRMILAANQLGCVNEVLIIAAGLSIQDPRERPSERQAAADQAHATRRDDKSDFLSLLKLWNWYVQQRKSMSGNALKKLCKQQFLNAMRMREWQDVHRQLVQLAAELKLNLNSRPAGADSVHQALLTGLLDHLGQLLEGGEYLGARNSRFRIFPGSVLNKRKPKWVMAAEVVETSQVFARMVAKIEPEWVENAAPHLLKTSHFDPHWEKRAGQVAAFAKVTLYGLVINPRRKINYGPIDPTEARRIFIRKALVEGEFNTRGAFLPHNRQLLSDIEELETRSRRRDILVDEERVYAFYDERVPEHICNGPAFEKWRKQAEREDPKLLYLSREALMVRAANEVDGERFPDSMRLGGSRLAYEYSFEPGSPDDGVTLVVPLPLLNQLDSAHLSWLVPGLLDELLTELIRGLPKALRRNFVPAPNFAEAAQGRMTVGEGRVTEQLGDALRRISGITIAADVWNSAQLPDHLRLRYRVVDDEGETLGSGRDLELLRDELGRRARQAFGAATTLEAEEDDGLHRDGLTQWDFDDLPAEQRLTAGGMPVTGYPALVDQGLSVGLRVLDRPELAAVSHRQGLFRLYALNLGKEASYISKRLTGMPEQELRFSAAAIAPDLFTAELERRFPGVEPKRIGLGQDILVRVIDAQLVAPNPTLREQQAFHDQLSSARSQLVPAATELWQQVLPVLQAHVELRKKLNGPLPMQLVGVVAELQEQLAQLVYHGFISTTPDLRRLPIYLQAIGKRMDKLVQDPARDKQRAKEIAGHWRRYQELATMLLRRGEDNPELQRYRWMIEELRVSIFAQELGTAGPVSGKRLDKQWESVRKAVKR